MFIWIAKGSLMDGRNIIAIEGQVIPDGALDKSRIDYFVSKGKIKKTESVPKPRKKRKKKVEEKPMETIEQEVIDEIT